MQYLFGYMISSHHYYKCCSIFCAICSPCHQITCVAPSTYCYTRFYRLESTHDLFFLLCIIFSVTWFLVTITTSAAPFSVQCVLHVIRLRVWLQLRNVLYSLLSPGHLYLCGYATILYIMFRVASLLHYLYCCYLCVTLVMGCPSTEGVNTEVAMVHLFTLSFMYDLTISLKAKRVCGGQ